MSDYDFRNLSPIDFEELARDLLSAELGVSIETFAPGKDGGIDLRTTGANYSVIGQCKHRPGATKQQILASIANEKKKLAGNSPQEYYFITSAALSPSAVDSIAGELKGIASESHVFWHSGTLNSLLRKHERVEKQHFKLWLNSTQALNRIVKSGKWARSEALLTEIQHKIRLYVQTPKFKEALDTLQSENAVLISGAPGVGKSTLAEMLLLSAWENGWRIVSIISDLESAWSELAALDDHVIFYYDDFLGQSSMLELRKNEGGELERFISAVRRDSLGRKKLVMTTREQMLNLAQIGDDDRVSRAVDLPVKLQVRMEEISRANRARMLFNHLYFSCSDNEIRSQLSSDQRYFRVIDHQGFSPRVLHSVILLKKPRTVDELYKSLEYAMQNPEELWRSSFAQLSINAVRLLLQIVITPGRSVGLSLVDSLFAENDPREREGVLRVLDDTWIRISKGAWGGVTIELYDPSRLDFLLNKIDEYAFFKMALDDTSTFDQLNQLVSFGNRQNGQRNLVLFKSNLCELLEYYFESESAQLISVIYEKVSGVTRARTAQIDSHLNLIIGLCRSIWSIDPSLELANSINKSLDYLDELPWESLDTLTGLSFDVAMELSALEASWVESRVRQLMEFGAANISGIEAVESYAALPDSLRQMVDTDETRSSLAEELSWHIRDIGENDDAGSTSAWLDDLEDIAVELELDVDFESARNKVGELLDRPAPSRRLSNVFRESENNAMSDEQIVDLFRRLS